MESRSTYRKKTNICWQYIRRLEVQKKFDSENKYKFWEDIDLSLKKAIVKEVKRPIAEKIILEYEWLGDMAVTNQYYGIFFENFCGGVICINKYGQSSKGEKQFGLKKGDVSYFARGACPFWTPKGTASKLLSLALRFEKKRGAKLAIAFADSDAGEMGTVYQATNWLHIGNTGSSPQYYKGDRVLDTRSFCHMAKRKNLTNSEYECFLIKKGWKKQLSNPKKKYIYILADGKEKDQIIKKIKKLIKPYPKRTLAREAEETKHLNTNQEKGGSSPTSAL